MKPVLDMEARVMTPAAVPVTVAVTLGVDANAVAKVTASKNVVPSVVAVPY